jgi:hypothetical protein
MPWVILAYSENPYTADTGYPPLPFFLFGYYMPGPKGILKRNVGVDWTRAVRDESPSGQINLEKIFMEE